MSDYNITFFTPDRLAEFWEMVTGLLKFASPSVIIFVAIALVGMLMVLVITAFKQGADDDHDDRDYDIKYYD